MARANVFGLQIRKVLQDFALRHSSGQQIERILDANPHAPDARTSAALLGIKGDSIQVFHTKSPYGLAGPFSSSGSAGGSLAGWVNRWTSMSSWMLTWV
jgi:hypothetical protein